MAVRSPTPELAQEFSDPEAKPVEWAAARDILEKADLYWLSTVRPDGRPHVTPLIAVLMDDALYFCTGGHERKARNLEENAHVAITTGCNTMTEGMDVVLEGKANRFTDETNLQKLADAYVAKYGEEWRFRVKDGAFEHSENSVAIVFEVKPAKGLGFGKAPFSQTKWRF